MVITGKTQIYGIIGHPVEHSLSPVMHNAAFRKLGMDSVYVPFDVAPCFLEDAVRGFRAQHIQGFNVTVPHKVEITQHLDRLDKLSRLIGAVNTVLNRKGELIGYNTDATGAMEALKHRHINPHKSAFAVVGAGGAARAIVFSLAQTARKIIILNRTPGKAERLRRDVTKTFQADIEAAPFTKKTIADTLTKTDVLINAASIGMKTGSSNSAIEDRYLRKDLTVFDIVYGRSDTYLVRKAKQFGCRTIDGREMLLHQGAAAFEIWTGRKAPLNTMRDALSRMARR